MAEVGSAGTEGGAGDNALVRLGALLTGTEARLVAHALHEGGSVPSAFAAVGQGRRTAALGLVSEAGLRSRRDVLVAVLKAIEGARSHATRVDTLWTMPGHLAGSGGLTSSLVELVDRARSSIVCSTFNFQRSSGMWEALRRAATQPGVSVRVYLDAAAAASEGSPSPVAVAKRLAPAVVLATGTFDRKPVRNHAKFVSIDHRWVVITSANFSRSAEYGNVELGVVIDDPNVADRIEREMRDAEDFIYERVPPSADA
ncbi:DISARM system phospholipase D-like protein DrmC [Promicromonospora sp. CA-289599]|uniref:DISARM system phospholipase D-like protein DrmC n=1 Tax=Promicromonospora sp. CA-289599 TaxID=3240014 RepID=UPI003D94BA63